ncbi:hypothetical protein PHAVU_006G146800 [Phaseolus vulgaris]|uniref:DUF1068 domain-containing protein n=1 Tax=Phaseolus vulgaris TaxID=3885 RepID=V7BRP8_PHAVU|nr:hypothetical protein PHAVU_006G146800g [Phaseolus vulgaris]ESW19688.1 hypothetical protein PHAVU_006G146800g [Phaseolus vulgaris]
MNRRQEKAFRLVIWILGLFLIAYIAGRPLYWHLNETLNATSSPCPPCQCDCSLQPLISLPEDCMRHDQEVTEEVVVSFSKRLAEEVKKREVEAEEKQRKADTKLLEAKKIASQYQKEADKCNSGMETCEQARERAETALENQLKETALWEVRARQRGWNKDASKKAASS